MLLLLLDSILILLPFSIIIVFCTLQDIPVRQVLVLNAGDTVDRIQVKPVHPCLLPKKRYVYLMSSGAYVCKNPEWWLSLTGLQDAERRLTGLPGSLTSGQTQDLCGNAFSSNVMASLLRAVLVSGLCDK